jgi:hypothetical protein
MFDIDVLFAHRTHDTLMCLTKTTEDHEILSITFLDGPERVQIQLQCTFSKG